MRVQRPTLNEMDDMLVYIDSARRESKDGRAFTMYEDKLEANIRELVREVKRLRRKRGAP